MSALKQFDRIERAIGAAVAWGFRIRRASTGHFQILQNRSGFGPDRVVAVFPRSADANQSRVLFNAIMRIKRETGIDIRKEPERVRLVESADPQDDPEPPTPVSFETPAEASLRRIVREELEAYGERLAAALAAGVRQQTSQVSPAETPVGRPTPAPEKDALPPPEEVAGGGPRPKPRKPRKTLTAEERARVVETWNGGGVSQADLARTFHVSPSGIALILKQMKARTYA